MSTFEDSMISRNPHLLKLSDHYLFVEIQKRKKAFLDQHPDAEILSLGIGDTTTPFSYGSIRSLMSAVLDQGSSETYCGYGPEQGILSLREEIAHRLYQTNIEPDEVFISDGAKCDAARLQFLLGSGRQVAIQDPTYPVYLDASLIQGASEVILLPCLPDNDFFPTFDHLPIQTLLYICSPNNPTGIAYTKKQLQKLVEFAHRNQSLILFDAAYSGFIQDPNLPKSIFEIDGSKEVAIELNSFSKLAGFTGIRLGWNIVPKSLRYNSGESIHSDWKRIISTTFNGASILSQKGALALLNPQEFSELELTLKNYLKNAALIKSIFESFGFEVYGADHSPYIWVKCSPLSSWEAFTALLETCHLITTPGSGFGPSGEGFIRLSAFGSKSTIQEAIHRLKGGLKKIQEKASAALSFS